MGIQLDYNFSVQNIFKNREGGKYTHKKTKKIKTYKAKYIYINENQLYIHQWKLHIMSSLSLQAWEKRFYEGPCHYKTTNSM